jgi:hypothetical protein
MDESDLPVTVCKTQVVRETAKAILVTIEGEAKWVPKSVIHADSEVWNGSDGREGELIVKAWYAHKEGWD